MNAPPRESDQYTARLTKCAMEIEDCRAYWLRRTGAPTPITPQKAFDEYWFGSKSVARIKVLLQNMRARFDAFPAALAVLHRWADMEPDTRKIICHWHLQLADPLYRTFTGEYLVARREAGNGTVSRHLVVDWVAAQNPERWTTTTRIQFATNLLSCAASAGLVGSKRDPRPITIPRVADDAIEYLLHLLRGIEFQGSLVANPYWASVGLSGSILADRFRGLASITFHAQADLTDIGWRYADLASWAESIPGVRPAMAAGAVS